MKHFPNKPRSWTSWRINSPFVLKHKDCACLPINQAAFHLIHRQIYQLTRQQRLNMLVSHH